MLILNLLSFFIWCISVNTRYILYYSDIRQDSSYSTFDCLYAYLVDHGKENGKRYIRNSHLIPYCRRPDDNEEQDEIKNSIKENIEKTRSFKELKEQNITSKQLLEWFSPIDVAEKYQMNRNDLDVFHNCSSPWFGSHCQYKFNYDSSLSFVDILQISHTNFLNMQRNISDGTCYRFLSDCNRGLWPLCLDWREICDGKIDCMNEEDEKWCDQLEMIECNSNEYRCHYGGQCIPLSFLRDSRDSIDGSDEQDYPISLYSPLMNVMCSDVLTFRCQERISRYRWSFQCGDGQYLTRIHIPTHQSFCSNKKDRELSQAMFISMDHISNINCRKSFYCAIHFNRAFHFNSNLSPVIEDCEPLSNHCLSEWLFLPAYPILFGFFQFIYFTNRSANEFKENIAADFVCFNVKHCPILLTKNVSIKMLNELNCSHISEFTKSLQIKTFNEIYFIFSSLEEFCLKKGLEESCQNSSYFYCNKSMKCIRNHRVVDGTSDCFFDEDELFDACQFNHSNRFKCKLNTRKCLMHVAIGNGFTNCQSEEDELFVYTQNLITLISFTDLCNLKINDNILSLKIIETDETNCHLWPCDNPYKHCDQRNHCPNGIDELNCPDTKCSFNEFECLNNRFELSYCIPLNHIYEKYLYYYNDTYTKLFRQIYFYNGTNNINEEYFSWNSTKCITLNNLYLINHHLLTEEDICLYQSRSLTISNIQDIKLFQNNESLCNFKPDRISSRNVIYFFKATRLGYLQKISTDISVPTILKPIQENKTINHIDSALISHCHRGIPVLTGQNKTIKCFCPPNYFGSQCQWQNQRISLTLQLHCPSTIYTNVVFQLLIIIIDQDGQILPYHEQITYIPNRDCNTKFNIYLLYPDRPKSLSNNYSIRIDLYEKTILNSWTSWFISIPFQFLPVNRISTQLIIPEIQNNDLCTLSCGEYGKCRRYINNKSSFFCQCDQGYSGSQCQIKSQCNCSNDSFCFHPSICICPLNKFGFYCHLTHSVCQSLNNSCQHNGLCIPTDDWINLRAFTCFCSDDYSGERCQNKNNQIDIHLDETIISNNHFICILRQKFSCLKI